MPSFTAQVPGLRGVGPVVEIRLAQSSALIAVLTRRGEAPAQPTAATALIDTGAAQTIVREDVPAQLGIQPVGQVYVGRGIDALEYQIQIAFPNGVAIETGALALPMRGLPFQCCIGRDVLEHAVFIYTGYTQSFSLSF